jgi:hypothetical protein
MLVPALKLWQYVTGRLSNSGSVYLVIGYYYSPGAAGLAPLLEATEPDRY